MTTTAQGDAGTDMSPEQMTALIERHIAAEGAGDVEGALAVYTDDVEHDVVGSPTGPLHGLAGARGFYEMLTSNLRTIEMRPLRSFFGPNHCTIEHQWVGTVEGEFMGVPGQGKRVDFRMLHVFEFRDGRISRENVCLDGGTIMAQLTT